MNWAVALQAAGALALGLFYLLMPVRWWGYNPVKRRTNPGFDLERAAANMWKVRLAGVVILLVGIGLAFLSTSP